MIIEEIFCKIDDFCQFYIPKLSKKLIEDGSKKRYRNNRLSSSEIMTILIWYHQSKYKDFKSYYQKYVQIDLKKYFPNLLSYNRFIALIPNVLLPMSAYLKTCMGKCTGISYVDSTSLMVCSNKRTNSHKVFKDVAAMGKTTKGWFFGLKMHLLCNHKGELLNINFTSGNVNDLQPLPSLTKMISGKLFGDKGYISKEITDKFLTRGLQLFTSVKKNMKDKIMSTFDKILLRKRSVIESVFNQLKYTFSLEHTRHRSIINSLVQMISSLIAYCKHDKKASITINEINPAMIN